MRGRGGGGHMGTAPDEKGKVDIPCCVSATE